MIAQIKRKPQVAIVFVNFLGFNLMPRKQHAIFDILDFYSYVSIKKRMRPDAKRLAQTIEVALK